MAGDNKKLPRASSLNLVCNALDLIKKLDWLSPTDSLIRISASDLGRGMEPNLNLVAQGSAVRLQVLNNDMAIVVISMERYEEILEMKELFVQLVEHIKDTELAGQTAQYEGLNPRISSAQVREAVERFADLSDEDLSKAYRPGKTESP